MTDSARVHDLLTREGAGAERLLAVLESEAKALAGRDAEALERLLAEKQQCIAELEQIGAEQRVMLEGAGLPQDRDGLEQLLRQLPGKPGELLRQQWERVRETLGRCRDQNLANGHLLEGGRRFAQQALGAMLGSEAGAATELYDRAGGTSLARGNRSYAKA